MAFRFRLEKVLTYRQRLVDRKALELAAAGRRVFEITAEIEKLDAEIARQQADAPAGHIRLSVTDRVNLLQWIEHLHGWREGLVEKLTTARDEETARRAEMVGAWQDLEVLKKLKEKRRAEWQTDQLKLENEALDEIGVQRADRARRERLAPV